MHHGISLTVQFQVSFQACTSSSHCSWKRPEACSFNEQLRHVLMTNMRDMYRNEPKLGQNVGAKDDLTKAVASTDVTVQGQ
ncbi:hypothetical protein CPC08DRAFT_703046 [Agrocybe pediades]|nr:hypothetical protein CPC08DRAFT_703046 [Agrocybe pediades]